MRPMTRTPIMDRHEIVRRLNDAALAIAFYGDTPDLLNDARDEIKRLREALSDIRAHCEGCNFYLADAGLIYRLAEDALNPPPERKPDLDEEIVF